MIHTQIVPGSRRSGVLLFEVIGVTLLLAVLIGLVTHFTVWGLAEQRSARYRQAAMEGAANILETARALPWEELTPAWAKKQQLPPFLMEQLPGPQLVLQVEQDTVHPHLKRVTVEVRWATQDTHPPPPIRLVTAFAARSAPAGSGEK